MLSNDGADKPLCLPQCQAEDRSHRQRRRDRQGGIMRLAARRGSGFCPPCRDRLVREPERQAAPLAQCRVIVRPIGDPIAPLRDMMTVFSVKFERHGGGFR
jgi:hypothetical protein